MSMTTHYSALEPKLMEEYLKEDLNLRPLDPQASTLTRLRARPVFPFFFIRSVGRTQVVIQYVLLDVIVAAQGKEEVN